MHGLHHESQDRVQQAARILRIAVGEELHRALQVGEQHGHLLALALQGGPGREDLLGEVRRRVALRGGRVDELGEPVADRLSTVQAEAGDAR